MRRGCQHSRHGHFVGIGWNVEILTYFAVFCAATNWPAKGSEIALARRVAGQDCSRPAPSERHVQVSLHAAQALPTPLAERGHATSNTHGDITFTIRAWSPRTVS